MSEHEWQPGDKALIEVRTTGSTDGGKMHRVESVRGHFLGYALASDLIPVPAGGEVEAATEDAIARARKVLAEHADITVDFGTPRLYAQHGGWNTSCVCGEPICSHADTCSCHDEHVARALAAAGLLAGGVPGRKSLAERARERGVVPDSMELDLVTGRRVDDEPVPGRSEAETEWGVRYGDGEVDRFADRENAEKALADFRARIANADEGWDAKDYEPMTLVRRSVVPVQHGPWRAARVAGTTEAGDDMCPNCLTPWKCNGPHVPAGTAEAGDECG